MGGESELRALESRVMRLPVAALERRVAALEQGMRQAPDGFGVCVLTFAFTVTDLATGAAVSGASVTVLDGSGGTAGTATTDGSGMATVVLQGWDLYTYRVSDPGVYGDATGALSGGCGVVTRVPVAMMGLAWGVCSGVPSTLTLVDPKPYTGATSGFTVTLTYAPANDWWIGCVMGRSIYGTATVPIWYITDRTDTSASIFRAYNSINGSTPDAAGGKTCSNVPNLFPAGSADNFSNTSLVCSPLALSNAGTSPTRTITIGP